MRDLMNELRQGGTVTGGPAPMAPRDRSRFLSRLDEAINAVRRPIRGQRVKHSITIVTGAVGDSHGVALAAPSTHHWYSGIDGFGLNWAST